MSYILTATRAYREDLENLPKYIRENKVPKFIEQIQNDPNYPGLDTHNQLSLKSYGIKRSRVDDSYRCLWSFEGKQTICLRRILDHEDTDSLETYQKWVDSEDISSIIPVSEDTEDEQPIPKPHTFGGTTVTPIFDNLDTTFLRFFNFSDELISKIKNVTKWEQVEYLPLKELQFELLQEIYTSGFDPGTLITLDQVLYRANADQLKHYCLGKIKSLMLNLTDEQRRAAYAKNSGVTLVKGVAGSGKTTIGVYRAIHLAQNKRLFDTKPILFLTYTETFTKVIKKLFKELITQDELDELNKNVVVSTIRDWAKDFLQDEKGYIFHPNAAESLITYTFNEVVTDQAIRDSFIENKFLVREIAQVIKGRNIKSLEEYLQIKRYGMGKALQKNRREIIWKIYEESLELQEEKKFYDESDLYLKSIKKLNSLSDFEPYAEVIIDEAQDLPPAALQLCAILAGGGNTERLTLLADPSQSIYCKGIPWRDGNLIIHSSCVKTLKKNFRNSRQILEAAWELVKNDKIQSEEIIEPEKAQKEGRKPFIINVSSQSDQQKKAAKEIIQNLHKNNVYRLGDIAVLLRKNDDVNDFSGYLKRANIPVCGFRNEKFDIFENDIKAITYHSAKGLEFPVVILMNVNEGNFPRDTILNTISDKDEMDSEIRLDRQLLYVGMTRASELLYLIATSGQISRFVSSIPRNLLNYPSREEMNFVIQT